MISIIITGRNDNYFGDFKGRLRYSLSLNIFNLNKHSIPYEIVFIEWNPLKNLPYLCDELREDFKQVRYFIVDPLLHNHVCENKYINFYEFFAKNIGARRSRGDFILFTNAEIIFGSDVLSYLSKNILDPRYFYRAPRIDVDEKVKEELNLPEDALRVIESEKFCLIKHYLGDPPYTNASGDFTLCSKKIVDTVGGYDENIRFATSRQDSRFLYRINGLIKPVVIGSVYHINHIRHANEIRWTDKSPVGPNYNPFPDNSYINPDYGFSNIVTEETQEGKIFLRLKDELRDSALIKIFPEPILPLIYRPQ